MAPVIRAVIFDLDGLMVDSEPLQIQAWQVVAQRYGRTIDAATFDRMFGLRVRETAVLVAGLGLPATPEALLAERNEWFLSNLPGNVKPMPGLYELVAEVRGRGLSLGLATSGERRYVQIVLSELDLDGAFDATVVSEDVSRGKPAPDVYLLAARRLGLLPGECLALEDAPNGVAAAHAAGMRCLAVPNQVTRKLDLSPADAVLPSLLAVRDRLDALLA